ncbi:hypothetical protein DY000_02040884 [Brassica cretica]|uniref:Uncharacterized protein n=1 Tax=Brassica cretica TaxID=69181 RepID=A0ABQ7B611_BRACR|nr:hypothetical protein DY000_02040884 [Brassica cretica]
MAAEPPLSERCDNFLAPVFHIERNKPEDTVTVAGMYSAIPYAISQVNHAQYSSSAIS